MNRGDYTYIWQSAAWPSWRFDLVELAKPMAEVSQAQGLLLGRLSDVGMALRDINDLLGHRVLRKTDAGGRSTSYELNNLPA